MNHIPKSWSHLASHFVWFDMRILIQVFVYHFIIGFCISSTAMQLIRCVSLRIIRQMPVCSPMTLFIKPTHHTSHTAWSSWFRSFFFFCGMNRSSFWTEWIYLKFTDLYLHYKVGNYYLEKQGILQRSTPGKWSKNNPKYPKSNPKIEALWM